MPLTQLAACAGLARFAMFDAINGRGSKETFEAISKVIAMIETGELRFKMVGNQWQSFYRTRPTNVTPQSRVVLACDWNEWGPCRNCGQLRYSPAKTHFVPFTRRRVYMVCMCVTDPEIKALGLVAKRR